MKNLIKDHFSIPIVLIVSLIFTPCSLFAAWPVVTSTGGAPAAYPHESAPLMADINGDGSLEVIVTPNKDPMRCLDASGNTIWTLDLSDPANGYMANVRSTPVLADVDQNPQTLEIILIYAQYQPNPPTGARGQIRIINSQGQVLLNSLPFGRTLPIYGSALNFKTPILVTDTDNNGVKELYFPGFDGTPGVTSFFGFNILNNQGQISLEYRWPSIAVTPRKVVGLTSVNLAGDQKADIISAMIDDGTYQGPGLITSVDSQWGAAQWSYTLRRSAAASPVAVDLDRNGQMQIIITDNLGYIYVLNANGTLRWEYNTNSSFGGLTPVVADITNDGFPEILYQASGSPNRMICLDRNGQLMWERPLNGGPYYTSDPVVADFNNDGVKEIAFVDYSRLRAIDPLGNITFGNSALPNQLVIQSSLSVADLNNDRKPEVCYGAVDEGAVGGRSLHYNCLMNYNNLFGQFQYGSSSAPVSDTKPWLMKHRTVENRREYTFPNRPPVMSPIGDKTVRVGRRLQFNVSASDPDLNQTLHLQADNLPTGAVFTDNGNGSGAFTWTPANNQAGVYNVNFTVHDQGGLTDSKPVLISVNGLQAAPAVAEPIQAVAVREIDP